MNTEILLESISEMSLSEKYIILMNTLEEQNQTNLLKIEKMKINLEQLYESLFKAESRVENLNGLLTDLHQTEANLRELSVKDVKAIEKTRTEIRNYKIKAKTHLKYLHIIMIVFSFFYYEFHGFNTFAPIAMMLIVIAAFQESTLDGMIIC